MVKTGFKTLAMIVTSCLNVIYKNCGSVANKNPDIFFQLDGKKISRKSKTLNL